MQEIARVVEHFTHMAAIKRLQGLAELVTYLLGAGTLLAFGYFVVLMDVVVRQTIKTLHRVLKTRGGHAPRTDGGPHQIDGLRALWQPLAKQKAVKRSKDQTLGPTRRSGDDTNVLGLQTMGLDVGQGFGASVDVEGFQCG